MNLTTTPKLQISTMTPNTAIAFQINRVAQMLDVSRSTVYRLVRDKQLTLVKVGKRSSRITATSITKFVNAREKA